MTPEMKILLQRHNLLYPGGLVFAFLVLGDKLFLLGLLLYAGLVMINRFQPHHAYWITVILWMIVKNWVTFR